jgi:LysR family transcriptional regulator for metE and metH
MDLELRHLHLVTAVAEVGSLTRAGDRLHLTQSALSHQLRDIESRLGTALFLRVGKRLVLTPAGEHLLDSARDVLMRLDAVEHNVRQMGAHRVQLLRLTTECYTCYHWLPPVLVRYRERYPHLDVRIDVDATSRPVPALLEGQIDVAIMSGSASLDRRLVRVPILDDELVLTVAPGHRLASRVVVDPTELQDQTLLLYPPKEESHVLQRILAPVGAFPRVQQIKLTEAIIELVKAGLGVAVLARWAIQPQVESGALVAVRLDSPNAARRWYAVTLKQTSRAEFVKAFVELLAQRAPAEAIPSRPAASDRSTTRSRSRRTVSRRRVRHARAQAGSGRP